MPSWLPDVGRIEKPGNRADEFVESLASNSRDKEDVTRGDFGQLAANVVRIRKIGLRNHRQFWPSSQLRVEGIKLLADGPVVPNRICSVGGGRLHKVHEEARPLNVSQELMTKPDSVVRPFNQTWHIGHDERSVEVDLNASEIGVFRREGVRGDLRPGARKPA